MIDRQTNHLMIVKSNKKSKKALKQKKLWRKGKKRGGKFTHKKNAPAKNKWQYHLK